MGNAGRAFLGSNVFGIGFVLGPEEAQELITKDQRNHDVLFPYLAGEDLSSRVDQSPSRWIINFRDWSLEQAETYPDCLSIVRERVKPERQRKNADGTYALRKPLPERWWHYADKRPNLYTTIAGMRRVLARTIHSKFNSLSFVSGNIVYSHGITVFAYNENRFFALLVSEIHEAWARLYSSSLETRMRYTPSDCFETYPFPEDFASLEGIGERYYLHRQEIMQQRQEGLTETYNRFHDPNEREEDIATLRALHAEMDRAVALAYGWGDLDLGHGFHQTKQGTRFTISEAARQEALGRLLALNHERYRQEEALGLHDAGRKGKKGRASSPAEASMRVPGLFDAEE